MAGAARARCQGEEGLTDTVAGLNPEQRAAVLQTQGPLLILAGAGSGKTRVLTRRIARLLEEGVRPWEILAVTFTNKAAGEMRARVAELVGPAADRILVSTFHSSCVRFLRRDIEALGYTQSFTIYDDDDQLRLLKRVCADNHVNEKTWPARKLRYAIDRAKNQLMSPEDLARAPDARPGDPTPRVFEAYDAALKAANAVDFNDLLNLVVRLWRERPDILRSYQDRFRYLMVDEYQDTNHAQYQLVKLLGGRDRNVAVVGDDDQSIYAFRGADVRNILSFERDFPESVVIRLERNYRSTANILEVANSVVRNNSHRMPKSMRTEAGPGEPAVVLVGRSQTEEAELVIAEIRRLRRQGVPPGDVAIIYRTNASSRAFESALLRVEIPYTLVGARKFFARREIRDILAYLRLILNPTDDMSLSRVINVPLRGIGAKSLEGLGQRARDEGVPMLKAARSWAEEGRGRAREGALAFCDLIERLQRRALAVSASEVVRDVIEESGYAAMLRTEGTPEAQARLENLEELIRAVEQDGVERDRARAEAELEPAFDEDDPDNLVPLFPDEAPFAGGGGVDDDPIARLRDFVDRASLAGDSDELPEGDTDGRVTLLTAHLAKGLEFPVVFVTSMFEGGFPHFRALEREEDIEEERRLVYVAITRARTRLILTRPRTRTPFGVEARGARGFSGQPVDPSRFLGEIPIGLLDVGGRERSTVAARPLSPPIPPARRFGAQAPRAPVAQEALAFPAAQNTGGLRTMTPDSLDAFQPGTRVMHPRFGHGIVKRREGPPGNPKLAIHFDRFGPKSILAVHARGMEVVLP